MHYPTGKIFSFCDYKVVAVGGQVTLDGRPFAPRIHYQESEPIFPDPNINFGRIGSGFFLDPEASAIVRVDCELISDLGDGILRPGGAIGTYKYTLDPNLSSLEQICVKFSLLVILYLIKHLSLFRQVFLEPFCKKIENIIY